MRAFWAGTKVGKLIEDALARVEVGEVGNEDVGESKNPGPDFSPDVRVGLSRSTMSACLPYEGTEHRFADPAALRSVPKIVEVHLPKVAVGGLDGNVPARRLLVNIVVAVKEAGTIGVVVGSNPKLPLSASLAGARFEHSEYQT